VKSEMVALLAFGCTFGAALLAMYIRDRLPKHHVEGDSKDLVKLVLGLIATLTAMVLGLLISSAHSAYDAQEAELQQLSIHLYQLDRILAQFGPEAAPDRAELRGIVAADVERIWPTGRVAVEQMGSMPTQLEIENIIENIVALSPKDALQRLGQSRAIELLGRITETRRLLIEQSRGAISWAFLFVLISWATILFFGFGFTTRFNATVAAAVFVGSLSVAGAIFLILQLNRPYGGWLQVSSAPLREVLIRMGH
jgi:hypothetical protein